MQTVDFASHHLIYLSGKNGHGKSALLDAMTWAVWGQARKVTNAVRADQGLIRLGQTQMAVIFDFEVNGQLYRAKREFLQTHNKPLVQLEFGLLNEETGVFIPLTDKTIRATQAKIEETIKLDYDSFINTAFLRQGNANEFSRKSPKERKEILGTILGLQQFDQLKKRALDQIKLLQAQRSAIGTLQESFAQQLAQKEEVEKEWLAVQKEQATFADREKNIAVQKKELEQKMLTFQEIQKKQEMAQFKWKELRAQVVRNEERLRADVLLWRTVHKNQRTMPDMHTLENEYAALKKKNGLYDAQFKERMALEQQKLKLSQAMQQHQQALEKKQMAEKQEQMLKKERLMFERDAIKKQEEVVAVEYGKKESLLKTLAQEKKEVETSLLSAEKAKKMQAQFEKRKDVYYQWVAQRNVLHNEQQSLLQRQAMVQDEDPSCPLCEQNLSAARKKFLKNKYAKEEKLSQYQFKRFIKILPLLKDLLTNQHSYLDEQKKLHEKVESITKEIIKNEKELQQLTIQKAEYAKKREQIEKLVEAVLKEEALVLKNAQNMLEKDETLQTLKTQLAAAEKQIMAISYDEKMHKALQEQIEGMEKKRASLFTLQQEIVKQ